MVRAALLALCLAACDGAVGTILLSPVTAPGSDLIERIDRVRLTLTTPRRVIEAQRDAEGELALEIEVDAGGAVGFIELEGFDAGGDRIAFGRAGPLPVAAIDADISIYLAPPGSLEEAPEALSPARTGFGVARLSFGVLLAGGRDAGGAPMDDLVIYNLYDHEVQEGEALPAPRAEPIAIAGPDPFVFLFGGVGAGGDPTASLHLFDTAAPPDGEYFALTSEVALARAGEEGAALAGNQYLVTGDPPAIIDGNAGNARPLQGAPPLTGTATTTSVAGFLETLVAGAGAGETGAVLFASGEFRQVDAPPEILRTGHRAVVLPGGDILIAGGAGEDGPLASAVTFDPNTGDFDALPGFLATARRGAAVASTATRVLVAGGEDQSGALVGDVEIFDALTLEPLGALPMVVPRSGAAAASLANGQVLIAGGRDEEGDPVEVLELFTPED